MSAEHSDEFQKEEILLLTDADIAELWEKLGPELRRVATRFLGAGRSVEDSVGIANAAFHSLIRAIDAKDLVDEEQKNGLWPVLIRTVDSKLVRESQDKDSESKHGMDQSWVMTTLKRVGFQIAKNKANEGGRRELAKKRGGGWQRQDLEPVVNPKSSTPLLLAEFEELLSLLKEYAEKSRQIHMCDILRMKLQGLTAKDIAVELEISEATVCRRLKELQRFIEEQVAI